MARSIERYLRMMPKTSGLRCSENFWYPAADVYKTAGGWVVKVELAGVTPDELTVEISGDTLRVSGTRRDETMTGTVSYHQLEITYSRFEKTIRFPCPVEGARVERHYRDGLLILYIRSPEECD
jgi:HSP20 family protein